MRPIALLNEYRERGAKLESDFVLEGDVRTTNDRFVADVRLLDMSSGSEIWTDRFEYDNVVQLQDAIANRTAAMLMDRLSPADREVVSKRLPSNLAAYEAFQTGYLLWRRRSDSTAHLQKAIELDQSFAPAYALLAAEKAMQGVKGSIEAIEAEERLQKAFALDENLADAYAVQGFMRIFHHRDWDGADRSLRNAVALDGNNVNAHHWLGVFYSIHRRLDEAKAELRLALEIDPTNPTLIADLGQLHYFAGEMDLGKELILESLAIDPGHPFVTAYQLYFDVPLAPAPDSDILREVENAVRTDSFTLPYINIDPKYDSIRETPRFQKILRDLDLPRR